MLIRRLLLCAAALATCLPLLADGHGAEITWPGWTIESGEEGEPERRIHTSFPLTYLVDDDPATAWVFSDKLEPDWNPTDYHYITIRFERPRRVDELRIMNGYNKSEELFWRNDRVTELRVKTGEWHKDTQQYNEPIIRTVALTDRMGWHSIRLPRREYDRLTIVFTKLVRGRDDDLCISGIELRDGGEKLPWHLPQYVLFQSAGCNCGGDYWSIMSRTGKLRGAFGDGAQSPSGRYVAGVIWKREDRMELQVGDLQTGETIYRWKLPKMGDEGTWEAAWKDDRHVEVKCYDLQRNRDLYRRVVKVRQ